MTEERIRLDERRRMELTLAISLLPEHEDIFNMIMRNIETLPLMPTPDPLRTHGQ
ncbi:hypothetical protein SAMN03159423_0213 [Bradyrhizobium sp. NFR13]|nr:hypothetical protein SAMN03159423_0213 [Bradyrhizobium sp. NFR13]